MFSYSKKIFFFRISKFESISHHFGPVWVSSCVKVRFFIKMKNGQRPKTRINVSQKTISGRHIVLNSKKMCNFEEVTIIVSKSFEFFYTKIATFFKGPEESKHTFRKTLILTFEVSTMHKLVILYNGYIYITISIFRVLYVSRPFTI